MIALLLRLQPASAEASLAVPQPAQRAVAHEVAPSSVRTVLSNGSYRLKLQLTGNRMSQPGAISVRLFEAGRPVDGARIEVIYTSLKMKMAPITLLLPRTGPGLYGRPGPALSMSGRWRLSFFVSAAGKRPFSVSMVDRVGL